MSLFSLLLRIVLCVGLIANGAGSAQAAARMQLAHAEHAVEAALPAPVAEVPCHPGAESTATVKPSSSHHAGMTHGSDGLDARDCCEGNACRCACVQHAPVVFTPAVTPSVVQVHGPVVVTGASQHRSPALPHLIRPPIG